MRPCHHFTIGSIVDAISVAGHEQSEGIVQINVIVQIHQTMQQNAALVEQPVATAADMHAQAGELATMLSQFRLESRDSHQTPSPATLRLARRHAVDF